VTQDLLETTDGSIATRTMNRPEGRNDMKRNLNAGLRGSLADVLDAEAVHMIRTFETDDHKSAAAAVVEKRAPQFQGQ
jgi:enoyl-CoA hydratase/carnithine racemase